jgi:hypothetical protein
MSGPILLANGSGAAPSLAFVSDPTSGMFYLGLGSYAFSSGGSTIASKIPVRDPSSWFAMGGLCSGTALIRELISSTTTPPYTFYGDEGVGVARVSAGVLGLTANGAVVQLIESYATATDGASDTIRNVLLGTSLPDDSWGVDGDIYMRHT